MTAPTPLIEQFVNALPAAARHQLAETKAVQAMVVSCIQSHGWTVARLAEWCSRDLADVRSPGAVIDKRLRDAAKRDMPADLGPVGLPVWHQPIPYCGRCSDQYARWALDDGPARRCPDCWTQPTKEGRPS